VVFPEPSTQMSKQSNLFVSSFITNTYHAIWRQNRTRTILNFLIRWIVTCLWNYLVPRNCLISCMINQFFNPFTVPSTIWRSRWPRGRWRGSVAARVLRLRIRIPPWAWLSLVNLCCQIEVPATGRSLVHRSPTECCVSECDLETSTMTKPRPQWGCRAMINEKIQSIYEQHSCSHKARLC
jgi:hypothetical protein